MLKSAENFLAGFFGLEWTNNATIEVIIERAGANNSLAGYMNCPNSLKDTAGSTASAIWVQNYLRNGKPTPKPNPTSSYTASNKYSNCPFPVHD